MVIRGPSGASGPIRPVGKKDSTEILTATAEPRSARESSEHLDIPIATSDRRIEERLDVGSLTLEDRGPGAKTTGEGWRRYTD